MSQGGNTRAEITDTADDFVASTSTLATAIAPTSTTPSGYTTSAPEAVGSPSASSIAGSESGLSSEGQAIIISSVIGGFAVLGLICVLALCFLRTRKGKMKKQKEMEAAKRITVESKAYTGVNESFAGVSIQKSNYSQSDNLLLGMPSPGPIYSPTTPGHFGARDGSISPSPSPRPYNTTPEASIRMVPSDPSLPLSYVDEGTRTPETPLVPPRSFSARNSRTSLSYPEVLPQTTGRSRPIRESPRSHHHMHTSSRISTVADITLMGPPKAGCSHSSKSHPQTDIHTMSPELPELETPMTLRVPVHRPARDTLDTMGFPVDTDFVFDMERTVYKDTPIVAPMPRNPSLNQKVALERAVRDSLTSPPTPSLLSHPALLAIGKNQSDSSRNILTPSPNPSLMPEPLAMSGSGNSSSGVSRVMSSDMSLTRESPVLGTKGPPVRISRPARLPTQLGNRMADLRRMESVSSNHSGGSTMPSIVSDSELERMGVGLRI